MGFLHWGDRAELNRGRCSAPGCPDYSLFIGDLDVNVGEPELEATFRTYYASTKQAKVGPLELMGKASCRLPLGHT
jgi:hypothetical protein